MADVRANAALFAALVVVLILTLRLPSGTPSWRCGVPTDPSRWHKVATREGGVAIEAEYTLAEFYLMAAIHEDVPAVVADWALELLDRLWALELGEREKLCQ